MGGVHFIIQADAATRRGLIQALGPMETILFLVIAVAAFWRPISYLYGMYTDGEYSAKKRWFTVMVIAVVFAVFGSSIGIVGFGGGIAGTIPGGLFGAYAGYRLGNYIFPDRNQKPLEALAKAISVCPSCNGRAAVAPGKKLLVTCPHCAARYEYGP